MKLYRVSFCAIYDVDATTPEEAKEIAIEQFAQADLEFKDYEIKTEELSSTVPLDYVMD